MHDAHPDQPVWVFRFAVGRPKVSRLLAWVAAAMLIGQGPAARSCPCALWADLAAREQNGRIASTVASGAPGHVPAHPRRACCRVKATAVEVPAAGARSTACCGQDCAHYPAGCPACTGAGKRCECGVRAAAILSASSLDLSKPVSAGIVSVALFPASECFAAIQPVFGGPDPPCVSPSALARLSLFCRFLL